MYVSRSSSLESSPPVTLKIPPATPSSSHCFLIFRAGEHYTLEDIEQANGKYQCHNCRRPIHGRVYFYPVGQHPQTSEFELNPIPHCRPSCALRTIHDMHDGTAKTTLLCLFTLCYGVVPCAPERFLLTIPGGTSIDEYHRLIDEGVFVMEEPPGRQSLFAPVYLTMTVLNKDHQLIDSAVKLSDELQAHHVTNIGPTRLRDNSNLNVVELPPKLLTQSRIADVFPMEPASFRPPMNQNPHMKL